jgi:hypothetical protein
MNAEDESAKRRIGETATFLSLGFGLDVLQFIACGLVGE